MKKAIAAALILTSAAAFAQTAPAAKDTTPAAKTEAAAAVKASETTIEKFVCGTGVEKRELTGESETFDASAARVFCWSKLGKAAEGSVIKHVWYKDGTKTAEVELKAGEGWRVWSSAGVSKGSWKVEAVDAEGSVISSTAFAVTGDAPAAKAEETSPAAAPAK